MKTAVRPLRNAKNAIIPNIPELAQQLPRTFGDRSVIRRALVSNLEEQGANPKSFSRMNLNKAERYAMVGFGIKELTDHIIEGSGREARFRQFGTGSPQRSTEVFSRDLMAALDTGASYVEQLYGKDDKTEDSWWNNMSRHYSWLGFKAMVGQVSFSSTSPITRESSHLDFGMRSEAIKTVPHLIFPAVRRMKEDAAERLVAAHDVASMGTSLAGMHAREFDASVQVDFSIVKRKGVYTAVFDSPDDRRAMFPRLDNLPSATFKCAAHALIESPEERQGDAEALLIGETSLRNLIHATINEAPKYDLI
ncbi:MAG: hypothetical protein ABWX94_00355 [Candidatus Saccharimonadales bacterium]